MTSLRGIFMLAIFLHHIQLYTGAGNMSVTFFFVLSGFSLTLGYCNKIWDNNFEYRRYISKRFARLYPIHWLTMIAILPLVLIQLPGNASALELIPKFFFNVCLLQSLIPTDGYYFSFNWVSWYLCDILIMAVLFPFFFRIINRMRWQMILVTLAVLIAMYLLFLTILPLNRYHALVYINPITRMLDFIIGICLGLFFIYWNGCERQNGKNVFVILGLFSFLITIFISFTDCSAPYNIAFHYWIPISLLIFSVSAVSRLGGAFLLNNRCMLFLGNISLSFFMIHQLIIRYAQYLHNMLYQTNDISSPIWITMIFFIVIMISYCSNKYFEKPVVKWLIKK